MVALLQQGPPGNLAFCRTCRPYHPGVSEQVPTGSVGILAERVRAVPATLGQELTPVL